MGSNLHDVYYCQLDRTKELSDRMYNRNIPSHQMGMAYFSRPVDTYATEFPILECRKESSVKKAEFPPYSQKLIFNPGSGAPYEGYSKNVDIETVLRNTIHPNQRNIQSKYIPSSKSDLYNINNHIKTSNQVRMTNNLLFKKEKFNTYNPNQCNLGHKLFHNHIRQQTKNMSFNNENQINDEIKEKEE